MCGLYLRNVKFCLDRCICRFGRNMRVYGLGRYGVRVYLVLLVIRIKYEIGSKSMGKVRFYIGLRKRMIGIGNERKNDMI